ncbi:MAG TPA: hypothetical protein VGB09_01510 [Candidatus Binatia bacterium]
MPSHDRVVRVHLVERPTSILDLGAEKTGDKLVFQFLDTATVGIAKKKSDHAIGEHPIDEGVDDRTQPALAAQFFK